MPYESKCYVITEVIAYKYYMRLLEWDVIFCNGKGCTGMQSVAWFLHSLSNGLKTFQSVGQSRTGFIGMVTTSCILHVCTGICLHPVPIKSLVYQILKILGLCPYTVGAPYILYSTAIRGIKLLPITLVYLFIFFSRVGVGHENIRTWYFSDK